MAAEFVDWIEVVNFILIILGGGIGFSVLRSFRGGKMASAVLWLLAAGGGFAIHEVIYILFGWMWPQPWFETVYSLSETVFIVLLIIGIYNLGRIIPRGV